MVWTTRPVGVSRTSNSARVAHAIYTRRASELTARAAGEHQRCATASEISLDLIGGAAEVVASKSNHAQWSARAVRLDRVGSIETVMLQRRRGYATAFRGQCFSLLS